MDVEMFLYISYKYLNIKYKVFNILSEIYRFSIFYEN